PFGVVVVAEDETAVSRGAAKLVVFVADGGAVGVMPIRRPISLSIALASRISARAPRSATWATGTPRRGARATRTLGRSRSPYAGMPRRKALRRLLGDRLPVGGGGGAGEARGSVD